MTGYNVTANNIESYAPSDTTQTTGFGKGRGSDGEDTNGTPSSGAGGGYYGGKAGKSVLDGNTYLGVSSSGSSYVAGFPGCPEFTNKLGNVFGNRLQSSHISNGFDYFPSLKFERTNEYEKGHQGNGAIKITRLELYTVCMQNKRNNNILFVTILMVTNISGM